MLDPVCGMTVDEGGLVLDDYPEYRFCSLHWRQAFSGRPERYPAAADAGNTVQTTVEGKAIAAPVVTESRIETVHLSIEGMTCASCVATIERALDEVPGVNAARVNFATEEAAVDISSDTVGVDQLVAAVTTVGYRARPATDDPDDDFEQEARHRLYRTLLHKFWFAAIVSLPVIYFSYPEIFPGVPEKGSTALNFVQRARPHSACHGASGLGYRRECTGRGARADGGPATAAHLGSGP